MTDREEAGLCPNCGCNDTSVDRTRKGRGFLVINGTKVGGTERYRRCNHCHTRFKSVEVTTIMLKKGQ